MFSDARDGALASSALCAGQPRRRMRRAAGTRRERRLPDDLPANPVVRWAAQTWALQHYTRDKR